MPVGAESNGRSPLLVLDGVETFYGAIQALKGVSFTVPEGSIVTLLGANGAGKTSLLRAVSGLLRFHRGSIPRGSIEFYGQRIDGLDKWMVGDRDFGSMGGNVIRKDNNKLLGRLAFRKHDDAHPGGHKIPERVNACFPILAERRTQLAGTPSGGEQQMLAIGRALMAEPALMLLDEPSLGLAPMLVEEIFAIIRGIHAGGTTVLLVEQNANKALSIADYGYVLETGTIVLAGDSQQLLKDDRVRRSYLGQR